MYIWREYFANEAANEFQKINLAVFNDSLTNVLN